MIALQVTCEYRMEGGALVPIRVHTIVISIQHSEDVSLDQLRSELMENVSHVLQKRCGVRQIKH